MAVDDHSIEKLGEQLREVGNELSQFPTQVDELLSLLDKVETLLAKVEQTPLEFIQKAYSQCMKGLLAEALIRHTDADVHVAVASCISEFTRITAPVAPYSDDQMKEFFQLIVSSFKNLSDISSRSYKQRVSILETVAKVRSWTLLLDLECRGLLSDMFQHFLSSIRDFHPEKIFISMGAIMSDVLEESDDGSLSLELLIPILASLKRNNEEISTSAQKLGESVLAKCPVKLKPYLKQAVKSLGLPLDGYSEIVATICNESNDEVEHNSCNVSVEKEKPEAAEPVSKPLWHDDEIFAIDKNVQDTDDFCILNIGQISEKPEDAELVTRIFRQDTEIVATDKYDRADDDLCIRNCGQISDKPEAADLVNKLFGHDDEIVAMDKNDRASDDFRMRNMEQIYIKPEATELVSKSFGHDDAIVVLDLTTEDLPTQTNNNASGDNNAFGYNAPEPGTKSQSPSQNNNSKGKNDDDQFLKLEETIGILAVAADESATSASKKRHLTIEDIQTAIDHVKPEATELVSKSFGRDDAIVVLDLTTENIPTQTNNNASGDNNAFGYNTPEPGTKSQIPSQNTNSKRKNDDDQFSKLEETIGILAVAADETAMPASKKRHLTIEDIQTETDHVTAFGDNAPASGTKSQSQSQTTTSKRTTKSKNDDEQSSKLEETISILAGVLKDVVDNKELPIPVEELWGFIHEMKLDEDLAGDAFVFLLDRPVQLEGLISTPIGIRKSILLKMMMRDAK